MFHRTASTGRSRVRLALAASLSAPLALGIGALAGCVGYASTPSGAKEPFEKPSPIAAVQEVSAAAARYVLEKHPIDGPYAINLPGGMTRTGYERVVRLMKDDNARILTTSTQTLPIVHIEFVNIIGDSANVRVFRPVGLSAMQGSKESPIPGGPTALTQAMEVRVRGGLAPWHAVAMRGLMLGALPTPELNIVPEEGGAPEPEPEPAPEPAPQEGAPAASGESGAGGAPGGGASEGGAR